MYDETDSMMMTTSIQIDILRNFLIILPFRKFCVLHKIN